MCHSPEMFLLFPEPTLAQRIVISSLPTSSIVCLNNKRGKALNIQFKSLKSNILGLVGKRHQKRVSRLMVEEIGNWCSLKICGKLFLHQDIKDKQSKVFAIHFFFSFICGCHLDPIPLHGVVIIFLC